MSATVTVKVKNGQALAGFFPQAKADLAVLLQRKGYDVQETKDGLKVDGFTITAEALAKGLRTVEEYGETAREVLNDIELGLTALAALYSQQQVAPVQVQNIQWVGDQLVINAVA